MQRLMSELHPFGLQFRVLKEAAFTRHMSRGVCTWRLEARQPSLNQKNLAAINFQYIQGRGFHKRWVWCRCGRSRAPSDGWAPRRLSPPPGPPPPCPAASGTFRAFHSNCTLTVQVPLSLERSSLWVILGCCNAPLSFPILTCSLVALSLSDYKQSITVTWVQVTGQCVTGQWVQCLHIDLCRACYPVAAKGVKRSSSDLEDRLRDQWVAEEEKSPPLGRRSMAAGVGRVEVASEWVTQVCTARV